MFTELNYTAWCKRAFSILSNFSNKSNPVIDLFTDVQFLNYGSYVQRVAFSHHNQYNTECNDPHDDKTSCRTLQMEYTIFSLSLLMQKGFPLETTLDEIQDWLNGKGTIENIQMRRNLQRQFKVYFVIIVLFFFPRIW